MPVPPAVPAVQTAAVRVQEATVSRLAGKSGQVRSTKEAKPAEEANPNFSIMMKPSHASVRLVMS